MVKVQRNNDMNDIMRTTLFRKSARRKATHSCRGGAALLFVLFIIFIVTVMVINVLDTTTLELSALRNSMNYNRAIHLANAGVHHAVALLEANSSWRGTITDGSYPGDDTYSATAVDGADATRVVITSSGVAGDVTRRVQANIEL